MNEIIWAVVEAYRLDSNAFKDGLLVPAIDTEIAETTGRSKE